jgi:VCBS repeat-containing protein
VPITLKANDADNDAIGVIVTKPASGQVTVTPTGNGTYTVTYTPDPQARLDAYSSGEPVEETIVITVTDGQLTDTRSVTVPVTPAQAAVTETRRPISGFVQVRGVTVGSDGNLQLVVVRPDNVLNGNSGYTVELINTGDPSHPVVLHDEDGSYANAANPWIDDVATDGVGNRYVLNDVDGTVSIYNGSGAVVGSPVTFGDGTPRSIFSDANGDNVYAIVETRTYDPETFTSTIEMSVVNLKDNNDVVGSYSVTNFDDTDAQFTEGDVADDGTIYITNYSDNTVTVVSDAGTSQIALEDAAPGGKPVGVTVDKATGDAYVAVIQQSGSSTQPATVSVVKISEGAATTLRSNVYTTQGGSLTSYYASVADIAVSPDGKRVYVTNPGEGTVFVVDSDTGDLQPGIQATDPVREGFAQRILFAPDGSAYVVDQLGGIHVISFAAEPQNL